LTAVPWLVTTPHGPLLVASWTCLHCPQAGDGRPAELTRAGRAADQTRAEAAMHVRQYGHEVIFRRGTAELLLPLATAAPAPKELTAP